jgi:hypothetical protein
VAAIVVTDRRRQSRRLHLVQAERRRARTTPAAAIRTLRLARIEVTSSVGTRVTRDMPIARVVRPVPARAV